MISNMTQNPAIRVETEKKHFESVATEVGYSWWGSNTPASKVRIQRRVNLAKEFLDVKPGDKLFECGCGTGELTSHLSEELDSKVMIYAMDLSKTLIKTANSRLQKPNVKFVVGNVYQTNFADDSLDHIIGNGILHHLDLDSSINEFRRILKPGGKILFFEPNMANPQIWLQFHIKLFRKITRMSLYEKTFWRWELKKKLLLFNLNNIKVQPFDFIHPLIPSSLLETSKKLEAFLEKTFLNEIAGSLLIYAENRK